MGPSKGEWPARVIDGEPAQTGKRKMRLNERIGFE